VNVTVRDAETPEDWGFIRRSWLSTYHSGGPAVQGSDRAHYEAQMSKLFAIVAQRARALVACDPMDASNVLGFIVYEGDALWFIYVVREMRGFGISRQLLCGIPIRKFNLSTIQGMRKLRPSDRGWTFTPCLVPELNGARK